MAHNQHQGAHCSKTSPSQSVISNMPAISEDDLAAEADEPPENQLPLFVKTIPTSRLQRRLSLLTKALHVETEFSNEDDTANHTAQHFDRDPSRSSTCSTVSGRSMEDPVSDDGQVSYQTRASTPASPPAAFPFAKQGLPTRPKLGLHRPNTANEREATGSVSFTSPIMSEPAVEAELGRRRCISFICGQKQSAEKVKSPLEVEVKKEDVIETRPEPPAKRPSALKFMCPSRDSVTEKQVKPEIEIRHARYTSPPPPINGSSMASISRRVHRESDTTIKNESPKSVRKPPPINRPQHRLSIDSDSGRTEATRFHEFASSDEEVADWAQESTAYRCRLTVDDTLEKELRIRRLGVEAEEEALEEEDLEDLEDPDDEDLDDDSEELSDDDRSDGGFQSDDEEGFGHSDDDEDDSGSDYEWWAPRRSSPHSTSTLMPFGSLRPAMRRRVSQSSANSDPSILSPRSLSPHSKRHKKRPVVIRPGTPELPDSTDFVCGTLDEDRPLEQAYIACLKQRQAAKHRYIPQDIDPTFPQSDPEIDLDDEEEDEVSEHDVQESDIGIFPFAHAVHGKRDHTVHRKRATSLQKKSPPSSLPKRTRSPPPHKHHNVGAHSPPPPRHGLFSGSPSRRLRSPPPLRTRLVSPPPSRRGSSTPSPAVDTRKGISFLGQRPALTHTASLPRHNHSMMRRGRRPSIAPPLNIHEDDEEDDDDDDEEDDDDDNESPSTPRNEKDPYSRCAVDIVQGLEHRQLRRRQKFYEIYCRKEEKKEKLRQNKRPPPGKGAQRMRQVATSSRRGTVPRMLSY